MNLKIIILIFFLVCFVNGAKPRKKILQKYAKKLIDYFDVKNLLLVESNRPSYRRPTPSPETDDHHYGCRNLDEIKGYFFDVYSSDANSINMTSNDLEHLIEYLVTRYPKNERIHNRTRYNKCHRKKCFQSEDITKLINSNYIDYQKFSDICPVLLFNFEIGHCEYDHHKKDLSGAQKWGFGLLLSGVVTLWSWSGAIVLPIIGRKIYKRMLTLMISLAFGCLTANSLLKYIPLADGFEIANLDETNHTYFYKHIVILFIIFFFFLFERSMKIFAIYKTQKLSETAIEEQRDSLQSPKMNGITRQFSESSFSIDSESTDINIINNTNLKKMNKKNRKADKKRAFYAKPASIDLAEINIIGVSRLNEVTDKLADRLHAIKVEEYQNEEGNTNNFDKPNRLCCTSLTKGISKVKPVGWMAIFGDGLGNFIDGLSIGASINQDIILGLTTALATWSGNIPQELGDFALLVRAGMSPFQALFYNFLSGNSVYLGCVIGIIFGSNIEAARWIFSISGASTMYLGLAVLLPEMNEEFEDGKEPLYEKLKITFIQVFGIFFGYWVMIVLNMYEDDITL